MFRALRRFILKKFGGIKRFLIFVACVGVILYCLHSLLSDETRRIWDVQGNSLNITVDDGCGVECSPSQLSFYIRTGEQTTIGPTVCFNGKVVLSNSLKNFGRGLNFVVMNSETHDLKEIQFFDTYTSDASLIRYLKKGISEDSIVIIASFDEAATMLKEEARKWLKLYGSSLADDLAFRDAFIMIGQKGLKEGHAIEYISKKDRSEDFATILEKAGCFSWPLGPKVDLKLVLPEMLQADSISIGEEMRYCGLPQACPLDTVDVGVYSGKGDSESPYICIASRIVLSSTVNSGGRGFNIVTLKSELLRPVSVMHADTYATDSTDLELYLESLSNDDIVIAVVADDGAKKLSYPARDLFNSLGSGYIQNLRFRDVWFFIGQKGMEGFSTMEQISYAGYDGEWPKPVKRAFCVPKKIVGRKIIPDPEFDRFDERRQFCKKFDGYPEFCDPAHVDDKLKSVRVADKKLQGHPIFETPLIIVPGLNQNAFVRTLETTLMQPGIKQENVMVMWDEKFPEYAELASLFGFQNTSLPSSGKYMDQMGHALKLSIEIFEKATHFIIIEEELLLAPDFLTFLAQCFSTLNADPTLLAVSAWNFNGFEKTSGNREVVYRVEEFPGLGFLAKRSALSSLSLAFPQCCEKRAWNGWRYQGDGHFEILMPDVSRIFRQPFQTIGKEAEFLAELFLRPRTTSLEQPVPLQNLEKLVERQYEDYLNTVIAGCVGLALQDIDQCVHSIEPPPDLPTDDKKCVAIFYEQENSMDFTLLRNIGRCFGLVSPRSVRPKNLHNGMLRFWFQDRHIFLIGSATPYYKNIEIISSHLSVSVS